MDSCSRQPSLLRLIRFALLFFFPFLFAVATSATAAQKYALKTSAEVEIPIEKKVELFPLNVRLNWNHQFEFAGFYAAKMLGLYEKAGLAVELHDWQGQDIVQEVVQQRMDIGVEGSMLVKDFLEGKPIKLLMANQQYSPLILISHDPITSLDQLNGKRIMLVHNYEVYSLLHQAKASPIQIRNTARLEDFIRHKTDLYSAYETNEPFQLQEKNVPFYKIDPKNYGVQSHGDLAFTSEALAVAHPMKLQRFKEATIEGWHYALAHPESVVDYLMRNYPVKKFRALLLKEAQMLKRYVKPYDEARVGEISLAKLQHIATDIVEMDMVPKAFLNHLPLKEILFDPRQLLFLTTEERAYLQRHPVLKVGNDMDWPPFEYVDEKGRYQGIVADTLKLIAKELHVDLEPNTSLSWDEMLKAATKGERDFLSAAVSTPERRKVFNFTTPYLSFPMVLAAQQELDYVPRLGHLAGQTVAVVEGFVSEELLKTFYPQIKVLRVGSVQEGLEAVISQKAMGYLGNLAAINYTMRHHGIVGLKVVGDVGERFELSMGVPKDNPLLLSILTKGLHHITPEQQSAIMDKWLPIKMVKEVDRKTWLQSVAIGGAVILLLVAVVGYLWRLKRQQQAYIHQINELNNAAIYDANSLALLDAAESYYQFIGTSPEEAKKLTAYDIKFNSVSEEEFEQILNQLRAGKSWQGQLEVTYPNGQTRWIEVVYKPQKNSRGEVVSFYTTRRDITAEKRVEQMSRCDELTQTYNRRAFNKILPEEMKRAQREGLNLTFVMLDIDHFKLLNDTYGHQQGDVALQRVAETLKMHFSRSNDFVFRLGGEEFGVICYDPPEKVKPYLESLGQKVQALGIQNENAPSGKILTISMGAVILPNPINATIETIYRTADEALYRAKKTGRNRVEVEDWSQGALSQEHGNSA